MPDVKLENKSARILHIGLGGGELLTVPPSDPTTGGGITVTMDDSERERFDKAIATPAVKEWIDAGELVIDGGGGGTEPEPERDSKARSQPQPERKPKHGLFGGDKDKGGE